MLDAGVELAGVEPLTGQRVQPHPHLVLAAFDVDRGQLGVLVGGAAAPPFLALPDRLEQFRHLPGGTTGMDVDPGCVLGDVVPHHWPTPLSTQPTVSRDTWAGS